MPTRTTYAIRLNPGQDLKKEIMQFIDSKALQAAWVVSCAGSLTQYNIRFANQQVGTIGIGYFEIVSLTGTLSTNGSHLHIAISDNTGKQLVDICSQNAWFTRLQKL